MQTTTLEITEIPLDTFKALDALAQQQGKSPAAFVREMIEVEVLVAKPIDEILAPIRQGFKESGMSEAELDALFTQARKEVRRERKEKAQASLSPREKVEALRQWVAGLDRNTPLLPDEAISRASLYTREDNQR
jgi:hypothetical protein